MQSQNTQQHPTTNSNSQTADFPSAPPEAHQPAGFDFNTLLQEAMHKPGVVNQAYRAFHHFSMGNQMLAAVQLISKGLPLSPIASFKTWKEKDRTVRKGQKAISLFMPVTVKAAKDKSAEGKQNENIEDNAKPADIAEKPATTYKQYLLRPNWFSLEQTEGADFVPELIVATWDAATALVALNITEVRFESLRGNQLGYAQQHRIAINPLNPLKHKTRFHEMAHIVLGHTVERECTDDDHTPKHIMEVEAEGVAYLLCCLLDLPGQAESRHYIQGWLDDRTLSERSAKRIFGAADKIMKAGQMKS